MIIGLSVLPACESLAYFLSIYHILLGFKKEGGNVVETIFLEIGNAYIVDNENISFRLFQNI